MKRQTKRIHLPEPMAIAATQDDLDVSGSGFYEDGLEDDPQIDVRLADSFEDPLEDWPEADSGADDWLREHHCRGDERLELS
jgi:hypothetical protein